MQPPLGNHPLQAQFPSREKCASLARMNPRLFLSRLPSSISPRRASASPSVRGLAVLTSWVPSGGMRLLLLVIPAASLLSAALRADDGWQTIGVPGAWEDKGPAAAKTYDGMAWYRTWVWPHDEFFAAHERNLFEESVTLSLPGVADAHEAFVNGVRVGGSGKFPPEFVSGRAGVQRHKVPPGTLKKGEWNEIAVRVYNAFGPGGFTGEAPFLMDYFQECVLEGPWEFRMGDDPAWAGKSRKDKPVTSAFDSYHESNRLLGESPHPVMGPKLLPDESARRMEVHSEFAVDLLLNEPLIAQPVHMSFDARGRLWVSQYRQYPYPAGVRPVSRDKYYRTHYDAAPPAPPNNARGRDRISVHEDTDGDGRYDRHLIFADGLNLANSAVAGRGGVWVMHTPHLLFYPDKDGDAVPDGPPGVRLTGFGLEDSHSVANGLVWGMDGWLYGCQGSTCSCRVTRPGIDPPGAPRAAFEGCMVWRYHPDTCAFEIFAEGSGNTFGLEIDSEGRIFSGHNGGETRGWHYVQGGFYLKQGKDPGKFGPARYPWTFGDLPMMRSTTPAPRFTHFFAVGEGTALPSSFQGRVFALDPLHNVVIAADRRPHGATFETSDIAPALKCGDTAFRPVYIVNAPDGSLLIADFYEHYIAHGQHYQSQIDATTGRIYRLRGKDAALERDVNLEAKTGTELVRALGHLNKWHRQTAVRLLGERRDPVTREPLIALLKQDAGIASAGALWSLHQADWLQLGQLEAALKHRQPAVRLWAVRLLGDRCGAHPGIGLPGRNVTPQILPESTAQALSTLAKSEPDAEVRSQLACTARRLPAASALPVIAALALRDEDAGDSFILHLCWYALEHHLTGNEKPILTFLRDPAVWTRPVIATHLLPRLMRRLVADGTQQSLLNAAALLQLAPDNDKAHPLLSGFNEAVQGRDLSGMPESLMKALAARGGMTLPLRLRNGEAAALTEALTLIRDPKARIEDRTLCIRTFGEVRAAAAVPALLDLATNKEASSAVRRASLAALAVFDDDTIPPRLLKSLPDTPNEIKAAAFSTLASRPRWASGMLDALKAGAIPLSSVPAEIIEMLRAHPDKTIADSAMKLFPRAVSGATDWQRKIAAVEAALNVPGGNPYQGETIYAQRCAGCHRLFFKGGVIGPDLTAYQRDNLGTMLVSIVNPNAEIREGFAYQMIETTTGQTISGCILERDPNVLRVRTLDGQISTLAVTELISITPLGRSLMPDGLLDDLTDAQLRDLFAWLRQSQPITK